MSKASTLFDAQLNAGDLAYFTLESGVANVFATGLGAGESLAVQLLAKGVSLEDAVDGDWIPVNLSGTALVLDNSGQQVRLDTPGEYRLKSTATAAAIRAGIYAATHS